MAGSQTQHKPGLYRFAEIEAHWQQHWERQGTFRVLNPDQPGAGSAKPKYYILDMFPYPSGAGLHVGHPLGYCATDIIARYKRMRGFHVLHPMGFDAFGLPAEQYAIATNVHPAVTTRANIDTYRRQLRMFGFSYDWSREVATSDPSYYKFTQWIFLKMFESWYDESCRWRTSDGHEVIGRARPIRELVGELASERFSVGTGLCVVPKSPGDGRRAWSALTAQEQRRVLDGERLAFIDEIAVNWCPALGTVLANEEVDNEGRSERGGHPVYRRPLRQWMLRITKYAERLLEDLECLNWPEPIKLMQRNWIGRSTGAEVVFPLADRWARVPLSSHEGFHWEWRGDGAAPAGGTAPGRGSTFDGFDFPGSIRVYTTRPDTLFGATYMVLAPEHPLVEEITSAAQRDAVRAYVEKARHRSDLERTAEAKEKTGVFTGAWAINPANGRRIPVWVADYVLMGYGTGAIMAVPGSDDRDYAFARAFDLPIVCVVRPSPRWIEERLVALTREMDSAAQEGFDEVLRDFPQYAEEIRSHRAQSEGLGARTFAHLVEYGAIDRLIDHYVAHPVSWGAAYTEPGIAVNSPGAEEAHERDDGVCVLNGLETEAAKAKITVWLQQRGLGRASVNYKLRDWVFSRQKYWGEPFPVLHGEDGEVRAVEESELPVTLPPMDDFKPTPVGDDPNAVPEPPLGRAKEWVYVMRDGKRYKRDLNTMPQWAGSCWYYLRFIDPHNEKSFCNPDAERYWMPVDLYVGGAEHAVLHLLYARFWHKVLFDLGFVRTREPFARLFNQGMIQSFAFRDERGLMITPDEVEQAGEDGYVHRASGRPVTRIVAKMSKALKNVVNPDEIIAQFGADTFRLYEMYMGPLDASKPWNTRDVPGLHKLCQRIWRLVVDEHTDGLSTALCDDDPDEESLRALHRTIKRVTEDVEAIKLNTAIAALFDFVNVMTPKERRSRKVIEPFVLLIAPFTPHLAEELWHRLGHAKSLAYEPWPARDERFVRENQIELAVQINGKVKTHIKVPADADDEAIRSAAFANADVAKGIAGRAVRKMVVVKGRLVNIVVENG